MRFLKTSFFNEINAYQLGWSLFGRPMMMVYCYTIGDLMVDTAQAHMRKEVLQIAGDNHIQRIYLTHHHEDHSGNAAAIKQSFSAHVYGHPITVKKMSVPFKILPYQKYMWGKADPLFAENTPKRIETSLGDMVPVHTPGHSDRPHSLLY